MKLFVLVAIVFVLGCCSVDESIPEEWSSYLVPITIDSKAGHYSEVSPSYITSICREYIDHCWEWNVELSRLRCNKPVVTCLVPDGVMVHSIDAGTRDSNKVPIIPCGGIIEIRQSSIHDAIVKFCDNYGLRCSFGHCSVTIDIDRKKTCSGCAKMPEDFHVGSHGADCQELVDDVISTKAK